MTARICVSILPKNSLEALKLIKEAENAKADLIEVRLDYLGTSRTFSDFVKATKIPLIATNKLQTENGFFTGTETERQQILLNAARSGFEYVDIELSSPKQKEAINRLKSLGVKPIVSYHKFDGALNVSEMAKIFNEQVAVGADVCKIVTKAEKIEDNLTTLNFVASVSSKAKLVCFSLGEQGKLSRLLSPLFGGFFTFASLEEGSETAMGQMTINQMRVVYDLLENK